MKYLPLLLALVCLGCDSHSAPSSETAVGANDSETGLTPWPTVDANFQFALTDMAAEKLREVLQVNPDKTHIVVSVQGGGCSGFTYDLQMSTNPTEQNYILRETKGVKLAIARTATVYLTGTTLDWQSRPSGVAGFVFDNPNAVKATDDKP